MHAKRRLVACVPLKELWTDTGPVHARRLQVLSPVHVKEMVHMGPVRLVFAEPGQPLNWVPLSQAATYWKREIEPHLADPAAPAALEPAPGGYRYKASEWADDSPAPIVLLEMEREENAEV